MKQFLREPLVHFILLGALLFAIGIWRDHMKEQSFVAQQPTVEISATTVELIRLQLSRQFQREPSEAEVIGAVKTRIREEILSREARALDLDEGDSVIRQRLAQKMVFLMEDALPIGQPTEVELKDYFAENIIRYTKPEQISFRHVFFSREKRGNRTDDDALAALARLRDQPSLEDSLGDSFLTGFDFENLSQQNVIDTFGAEFANSIINTEPGQWQGPIDSTFGSHLVFVEARVYSQNPTLDEVRASVLRDFQDERRRDANRELFDKLEQRYKVQIEDEALLASNTINQTREVVR